MARMLRGVSSSDVSKGTVVTKKFGIVEIFMTLSKYTDETAHLMSWWAKDEKGYLVAEESTKKALYKTLGYKE